MKAKNLNASSVKTRNLIRDTFAELLYEKKNINKITVTELVQRADINRSTFYSHYDDVRHVAEDIKAETLKAFFENKTIFMAEHDCPVSLVFELNRLQLIPLDFFREPCFPFFNKLFNRIEVATGYFFLCVAVTLDWPAFRSKPERPSPVWRSQ